MRKAKRLSIWVGSGLGLLIIVVVISVILAKKFINREHVKEDLLAYLSEKIGGEVKFESLDFHLFYRPHVYVKGGEFSIPGKAEGNFDTLIVYPKILPLIEGKVEISTLWMYRPDVTVLVGEASGEEAEVGDEEITIDDLRTSIRQTLDFLSSGERGLNAKIEDGSFVFRKNSSELITFSGLNASVLLPDDELSLQFTGNSSLWRSMTFNGRINVKSYKGTGNLALKGFEPHKIIDFSFPGKDIISTSDINLNTKFSTEDLRVLKVGLDASVPDLTLSKDDEIYKLAGSNISGDLYLDGNKRVININTADMTNPGINLSGKYESDKSSGKVSLFLKGNNVDAKSVRDGALFVAGENDIVATIFDVVRGGTVPVITLDAEGDSFRDLWRQGHFVIKGSMENGHIFIPVANFDILEAKGEAEIADGMLKGTNLSGKLGNSYGYNGTLLIGTDGSVGPLNLDIMVDADPAQVPPVIEQFVHDEVVTNEMRLITNVKGTAKGRLILGDQKKSPDATVSVSDFNITADYARFPYPVSVKGGKFNYDDKKIEVEGLSLASGKSATPDLSGSFAWKDDRYLKAESKDLTVDMSEVLKLLSSTDELKSHLRFIQSAQGTAAFSRVSFDGDLSEIQNSKIEARGKINPVNLNLEGLSETVKLTDAEIQSDSNKLSVNNANVSVQNSTVNINMVYDNYLRSSAELKTDFKGTLDPLTINLFSEYVNLPEELVFLSPVSVDNSKFVYKQNGVAGGSQPEQPDSDARYDLDISVKTDAIEWKDTEGNADSDRNEVRDEPGEWDSPVNGKVSVVSDSFKFKGLNWGSLDALVTFLEHGVDIDISEANLCGISTPGFVKVYPPYLEFDFKTITEDENLTNVLKCLLDKAGIISGEFDFTGNVSSDAKFGDVLPTLTGALELNSSNGRVNKFGGIAKFFTYLNFGELFRGQSPDFGKDGFPYDKLIAKADIEEGKIKITEAVLDGPSLKVVCEGHIDLVLSKLDLQVLVIPVMAVDSVINKIPLVSYLLGDKYVSIPIKVKGDISDPKIEQLSPSALRFGLLGIIKQTLNIPVTLIKPVNRDRDSKDEAVDGQAETDKSE